MRVHDVIARDDFVAVTPADAARRFDGSSIHLWCIPYQRDEGRAPLRALLAEYLGCDASALSFHDDEHGKPRLTARDGFEIGSEWQTRIETLHFNWSHSGDVALIALTRGIEIGVDVEMLKPRSRVLDLARRFFAHAEVQALADLPDEERNESFLRLWCMKEAVLKALGRGLAFGLDQVEFERDGEAWRPAQFTADAGDPPEWQVLAVNPVPGYVGALAWRGATRPVHAWRLSDRF